MILLRLFIVANTVVLALIGLAIAFSPKAPLLVRYAAGEPYQSLALVHILAMALAGSAIVLLLQSGLSLIGELRRFGLGLSLANGLISLMALMEQLAFGGSSVGWALVLLPFSAASALAAMALRPPQPADIAAEIESLKIPDALRQGLLRQIGEAAAQEERNRLARDLHDSIKQQLFSINVGTAAAQERWERDPEGARKALADVRRSAREAMVEMQAMLHQLRPEALGTAGLIEALREQCEALGYRTGAEVSFELGEPVPDELMPPGAPEALFRIGQEMLANVARHARARKVRVWLGLQDREVMLRVSDDGQGFDPAAEVSGMGLRNLKERAASLRGKLEVATSPGAGAELTVRIPPVSPPVPVPVNPRRLVLSELFLMIVMGTIFIPASSKLENGYWVGGAFALATCCLLSWLLGRSSPRSFQKLMNLKGGILTTLYIAWWVFGFLPVDANFKESDLWGLLSAICLYVVFVLAWLHRASDARRLWQKGHRFWLLLVLPVEAGILVALRSAIAKPRPLVLNALEVVCLLAMAIGFAYAASRQPRTEGAAR